MNKIFTLLLVGALTAGAVTANAESQIFKKKKKKAKAETEQPAAKDSTKSSMTEYKKLLKEPRRLMACLRYTSLRISIISKYLKT